MSMWKKWNKKSKKGAASSQQDEEELKLPPTLTRNSERNLSISRSGRHKMKKTQRLSVMSDDMYSPEATPSTPAWPTTGTGTGRPLQENNTGTGTATGSTTKPVTSSSSTSTPATHSTHAHTNVQSKMPSSGTGSYRCRETVDPATKQLSGSQRMARAPTAAV